MVTMATSLPPPDSPVWQDPSLCTYELCPISVFGQLTYRPSLPGNAFYLALFSLVILLQLGLAIRYRTWGYFIALVGGCGLEIVGYAGRVMLWQDDFNNNDFIIYLVGCTIGPAFFSAAIYLCLSRVVVVYGRDACHVRPRLVTGFFMACDLLALILQAAGGAITSLANTKSMTQTGINIMIAGLSSQVASMVFFCVVCAWIAYNVRKNAQHINQDTYKFRKSWQFKFFLAMILTTTLLILERCCYRVAELAGGFSSSIANNEVEFMILDGAAMSLVVILMTVGHPGIIIGRELWEMGAFKNVKYVKSSRDSSNVEMVHANKFDNVA